MEIFQREMVKILMKSTLELSNNYCRGFTGFIPGIILLGTAALCPAAELTYPVVDTGQTLCVGLHSTLSSCPGQGEKGYGQDAQYQGIAPRYTAKEDGTVTDDNTRLMWAQPIDTNKDEKITAGCQKTACELYIPR